MPDYPLHDKLSERRDEADTVAAFLDWLDTQPQSICDPDPRADGNGIIRYPTMRSKESLIGGYLGIDPAELSAEKDAMYRELVRPCGEATE